MLFRSVIQEDDQIESAVPLANRVVVEVNVVVELLTGEVLVGPNSEVLRVKEQVGDTGDV